MLLLVAGIASAAHIKIYVLTGQSNSLGTTNGKETDKSPGSDPADAQVKFWWQNWASATTSLGNCTNKIVPLLVQQGGYYAGSATHWGPEFGFGRALWKAGQRDFMIVKCSRGSGGNSFWHKPAADHHMYDKVRNAVSNAVTALTNQGHTFEVVGLLYLQGEGNSSTEAAEAGTRFRLLLDNLRADLPNASRMRGHIAGIINSGMVPDVTGTTRAQHDAVYGQYAPEIMFFSDLDLRREMVPDNLHFNVRGKLCIGARFADAVLGRWASYNADLVATNAQSPVFQGWLETAPSAINGQAVAGSSPDPGFTNNAWMIDDASAAARGYYYTRQFSSNQCSWASGVGWKLTASSRLVTNYSGSRAWVMQYGDAVNRWLLWAEVDTNNQLVTSWDKDAVTLAARSVVVQSNHDGGYHEFTLEQGGGTSAGAVLFDGQAVGSLLPIPAIGDLPLGVHWGTFSTNGTVKSHWQRVDFTLGSFSVSGVRVNASNRFQLQFPTRTSHAYGVFRSTNFLDWSSLTTNVTGTGIEVSYTDTNALLSVAPVVYRVRMYP